MKFYCLEIHGARSGSEDYLDSSAVPTDRVDIGIFESILKFRNEKYKPMRITVIKYSLDGPDCPQRTYHYLTGGDESDCVFYLAPFEDDDKGIGFYLDDPVCDSKLFRRQVVPSARDLKNTLNNIPAD